ncbi:MAG TPA: tRNA (5-methylaminomethyl-2-thiouridine)(34)-methyltransferase MnmD [Puia sp.]|uniref:tRNA (5-methylaminomethyl-2-thiouridine)(34)-methyltransferase MnmD n=1 Tax=Puia sp. TaxID=2045100 RepID=UPI002CAFE28D|nr:tRNA (5-methylaminomethyl-2-thiouridine)(34)-methyltransferase MnmD [Puia sp.]HVU97378.1 tRNA (5-methylaminomethyl-2-thiouridine)(34)-methyltransferase MnmD [Puia sp.]
MDWKLIVTDDGSHTLEGKGGITYHSRFGALQESRHIFIEAGLKMAQSSPLRIFEMGFGTGLNALLTLLEARPVRYETVETEPLQSARELNFCEVMGRPGCRPVFERLHDAEWERPVAITPEFQLFKSRQDIRGYTLREPADLVYYDAFDPVAQPELWTEELFARLFAQLAAGAVLVTYCCKGAVRRALQAAGFETEKLPGPPGKREFLRARVR